MSTIEKVIVECHDRSGLTAMHLLFGVALLAVVVFADPPLAMSWAFAGGGIALLLFGIRKLVWPRPSWRVVARANHLEWGRGEKTEGRVDLAKVIGYHLDDSGTAEHIAFQVSSDTWITLRAGIMSSDDLKAIEQYLIGECGMHDEKRGRPFSRPPGLFR